MIIFEVLAYIVIISILLGIIIWNLAKEKKFFSFVPTGEVELVVAGETFVKILNNIPKKDVEDGILIKRSKTYNGPLGFLEKKFGLFWIGVYPFRKVHQFEIYKERENPNSNGDSKPETWIIRDKEPTKVTGLRGKFPRPVLVPNIEFEDGIQGNLLILCELEAYKPEVPIFILNARFFELLASNIKTGVIEYCKNIKFTDFMKVDKKNGGKMSNEIISNIGETIKTNVGIELTGLAVSNYDTTDKGIQKILEAKERKRLQTEADISQAELDKKRKKAVAEGDSEADKIRASASIQDIKETVRELVDQGVDPNIAAQVASGVGRIQRLTRDGSKITTFVDGGSANVSLPIDTKGDKK